MSQLPFNRVPAHPCSFNKGRVRHHRNEGLPQKGIGRGPIRFYYGLMALGGSLFGELVDNLGWLGNSLFSVEDWSQVKHLNL